MGLAPRQGVGTQGTAPLVFARSETPARTRPGPDSAILRLGPESRRARRQAVPARLKNVDEHNRKPVFMFRLIGLFQLRYAQRTLLRLLMNEPPRNTRRLRVWPHNTGPEGRQLPYGLLTLRHPPNNRPISATILATCPYCPSDSHVQRAASLR